MTDEIRSLQLLMHLEGLSDFAAFWENAERTADFLREADDAEKILKLKTGLLVILVGPRGGGKTTAATWFVQDSKENNPQIPRISNVPIQGAIYVPDILKFLATKLSLEGREKNYSVNEDNTVSIHPRATIPAEMLIIIDEAAISGFESRGSGVGSALHTYLLALSRKLNVDIILISQMMSMTDKRAQWLADFYWLCEAVMQAGTRIVNYFRYRIYNEQYRKTAEWHLSGEDARSYLFGKFDTFDIPNSEALIEAYTIQYQISDEDEQFYMDIRDGTHHIPKQPMKDNIVIFGMKKALRAPSGRYPGETFLVMGKDERQHRYEVLQRDWDMGNFEYTYRAREIPNNMHVEDAEVEPEGVTA